MNPFPASMFRLVALVLLLASGWFAIPEAGAAPSANNVALSWATNFEDPSGRYIEGNALAIGPSGDVFLAGYRSLASGQYELFVTRHSPGGQFVWEWRPQPGEFPGSSGYASDITVKGTNVFVLSHASDSNGVYASVTLKYRDNGDLEWMRRYGNVEGYSDRPVAIGTDPAGNVLVAADVYSTNGTYDIAVLKYDGAGNLLWKQFYGAPGESSDRVIGMKVDASGNILVVGSTAVGGDQYGSVTLKVSPDGALLWATRETSKVLWGIQVSSMDIDGAGNTITAGTEGPHTIVWKYDAAGNRLWSRRHRAEEPSSLNSARVHCDASGNVLLGANLYGWTGNDAVVVKYSPEGEQRWTARIGYPTGLSFIHALTADAEGNTYLTGNPGMNVVTTKISPDGHQLWSVQQAASGFYSTARFIEVDAVGNVITAARSVIGNRSAVTLTRYAQTHVAGKPIATITPSLQVVDPGASVSFVATPTGTGPFTFQWRRAGRELEGETNAALVLNFLSVGLRGDYSVIVSNAVGFSISPDARLTVRTPPELTIDPTNQIAYLGTDAGFTVAAAGNDFITYQWRHNGTNLPGATNHVLFLDGLTGASAGLYDVVGTTIGGVATSSAGGLRISGAVRLVGVSGHPARSINWYAQPRLHVFPDGHSIIVSDARHATYGTAITVRKIDPTGGVVWAREFATPAFTNALPAAHGVDGAGNIYVAGYSWQSYLPGSECLLKYSPAGELLWSRFHTRTNANGLWINSLSVAPDGHSAVLASGTPGWDLRRYSPDGTLLWSKSANADDLDVRHVRVDSNHNTYVGSTVEITNVVRLRKFDSSGAQVWERIFGNDSYQYIYGMALDSRQNLIAVGTSYRISPPFTTMFVAKYSPAGERLWLTQTGGEEIRTIQTVAVTADDEIVIATQSDDDYYPEQSGITRLAADGRVLHATPELNILVYGPAQLGVDTFGNAYLTGWGGRPATGADVITAKYDREGRRLWAVHHGGPSLAWESGITLGVDALGDVRVLASGAVLPDSSYGVSLLHYEQRDPAGAFRARIFRDAGGTFHLATPASAPFRIEASTDLESWGTLSEAAAQQLLQPGATSFSGAAHRFYRLVFPE